MVLFFIKCDRTSVQCTILILPARSIRSNGLRTIRRAVVTPLKRKSQATPAISRSDSKPAVPPAARGRPIAAVARELVPVRVQRIAHECRHGNYCAHCGGGIPLGSRATYCGRCGTGLPKLSQTKAPSCGHCEHVLPRIDDATYCTYTQLATRCFTTHCPCFPRACTRSFVRCWLDIMFTLHAVFRSVLR